MSKIRVPLGIALPAGTFPASMANEVTNAMIDAAFDVIEADNHKDMAEALESLGDDVTDAVAERISQIHEAFAAGKESEGVDLIKSLPWSADLWAVLHVYPSSAMKTGIQREQTKDRARAEAAAQLAEAKLRDLLVREQQSQLAPEPEPVGTRGN